MIKSFTAFTSEIDDVELAVQEIVDKLDPENNCLTSTVAIITCYHEFATSGVIAELYNKMGFPIIGITSTATSSSGGCGQLGLSVMMITSDDVVFTAACSSSLKDGLREPFEQMYKNALVGHVESPKLIIGNAPLMLNYAGDHYVEMMDIVSGGVPHFGAMPIDNSTDYSDSYVIFNDKVDRDFYAIIVASGNIKPRFLYSSFSPEFILNQSAIITKSVGNLLMEIDGQPAVKYMDKIGLHEGRNDSEILHSIPFIFENTDDGDQISRVLMSWSEDEYGICGGLMPEGTLFSLGRWDKDDVLNTTVMTIEDILKNEDISTLLLYSCLARSYALDFDVMIEAEKVVETIVDRIPFIYSNVGGEICLTKNAGNNSFHNNTIIACVF